MRHQSGEKAPRPAGAVWLCVHRGGNSLTAPQLSSVWFQARPDGALLTSSLFPSVS